jgi:hypothetical protein
VLPGTNAGIPLGNCPSARFGKTHDTHNPAKAHDCVRPDSASEILPPINHVAGASTRAGRHLNI